MIGVEVFSNDCATKLLNHAQTGGLSFADIERQINIDRANISRCLRGQKSPSAPIWIRYAIYNRVIPAQIGIDVDSFNLPTDQIYDAARELLIADWSMVEEKENWMFMKYHVAQLENAGLSRDDITKRFNVDSWALVHNYRTGGRRYSLITALRLAKALGVPAYQFGVNIYSEAQKDQRAAFLDVVSSAT